MAPGADPVKAPPIASTDLYVRRRDFVLAPHRTLAYMPAHAGGNARTSGGAIAQLGERLNGIQEVSGSIPLGSTKQIKALAKNC
jgi:hypothetical protein